MKTINRINSLDVLAIEHRDFKAKILLQGAQLIDFSTAEHPNNWLFVSSANEYISGKPIRGGVPICWPIFGAFDKNPVAVQSSFPAKVNPETLEKTPPENHGFARHSIWQLDDVKEHPDSMTAALSLDIADLSELYGNKLNVKVLFTFSKSGFNIELTTTNNDSKTLTFSQALHTYFSTSNIQQSSITGFENQNYVDALTADWETKKQNGKINFSEDVDRIYKLGSNCIINTPDSALTLSAQNSNSTVVWNPWIAKSQRLSQFNDDDYLKMLCVETANALDDAVTLEPRQTHTLRLSVTQN